MTSALHYLVGIVVSIVNLTSMTALAQETWQEPPEPIASMLDTPWYPAVNLSPNHQWLVRLERQALPTLAELAQPRLQLAGLQINPAIRSPALPYTFRSLDVQNIETGKRLPIVLPEHNGIRNLQWSPTGNYLAFTLDQPTGIELWVVDMVLGSARRLTPPRLNNTYGPPCRWLSEAAGLLCKLIPAALGDPPAPALVPRGPRVEQNLGRVTPARTYTNLLSSPDDEALFEYYLASELEQVNLAGDRTLISHEPQLITAIEPSPDANWILLTTLQRPFSYQVPARLFPKQMSVLNRAGQEVYQVADLPLADDIPVTFDSVRTGRRIVRWRSDRPATLYWVKALDQGDAGQESPVRDAVYQLTAPFNAEPQHLWTTEFRYKQILWGHDTLALGIETWYSDRRLRVWQLNPAKPHESPILLQDRNYQDKYNDPGRPITKPGPYHRPVLMLSADATSIYLRGRGASLEGVYPFLDRWNLATQETTRLWQAASPYYESVIRLLDNQGERMITRRESPHDPPNYWLRSLRTHEATALTNFTDPRPWYRDVQPEVIRYERADGVTLSATLYLPPGYNAATDGPLPTVLWAYPREHRSRETAAQVTTAEHAFRRPYAYTPLFLLTQGYAVVMGPTMPIIGEGDIEPNDTYVQQLTQSAEAVVNYLVNRGVSQPGHLAIAGHSYGAFTAANLLAHTDLFSAGIANSGAYNRTLTPFGFQGEQRTFWDAQATYMQMSPFTHVSQINEPLLLIHGAEDANAGTYPIQSERLYGAMKGLGGNVRWVELPFEGHGYESREAIGHVLWEMTHWLDRYIKDNEAGMP